jgi:hypothetical protein
LDDLQAGRGLVGSMLKDDQVRQEFASAIHNLNVVSSNLATHGLLWKPPRPRSTTTVAPVYPGKNPSR